MKTCLKNAVKRKEEEDAFATGNSHAQIQVMIKESMTDCDTEHLKRETLHSLTKLADRAYVSPGPGSASYTMSQ